MFCVICNPLDIAYATVGKEAAKDEDNRVYRGNLRQVFSRKTGRCKEIGTEPRQPNLKGHPLARRQESRNEPQ